jgi:leader peptidase (prepilin peptidase)/N-methyltransferase
MHDGMPNALTVIGTAERIERAWREVTASVRSLALLAILTSGVLTASLALKFPSLGAAAGCWGVCGTLLALAAVVDVHEQRLPNELLAMATLTSVLAMCWQADLAMSVRTVTGGVLAGSLMMSVRVVRGVGMGDVKMAMAIGLSVGAFGWRLAPIAIAVAATAAAGYGTIRRRQRAAFGPALWFGWMSALVGLSTGWWS